MATTAPPPPPVHPASRQRQRLQLKRSRSLPHDELRRQLARSESGLSGGKDSGIVSEQPSIGSEPASGIHSELPSVAGSELPSDVVREVQRERESRARRAPTDGKTATIRQHYYPEGGWGVAVVTVACVVQVLCHGLHTAYGVVMRFVLERFGEDRSTATGERRGGEGGGREGTSGSVGRERERERERERDGMKEEST